MRLQVAFLVFTVCVGCSLSAAQNSQASLGDPASPWQTYPTNSGILAGTVQTADGAPAAGATVDLQAVATGRVVASTLTLPSGEFMLHGLPEGRYELRASLDQQRASEDVRVDGGASSEVRLSLDGPPGRGDPAYVAVADLQAPEKARNQLQKAQHEFSAGKYDGAEKHVAEALKIWPDYAGALSLQGLLLLRKNALQPAAEAFQHALRFDATCTTCYVGLADILNGQRQYADARRSAEHGLKSAPTRWQLHLELGKALFGLGDLRAASAEFAKVERSAPPEFTDIHFLVGLVSAGLGEFARAEQELKHFLTVDSNGPAVVRAQGLLASVQMMQAQQPRPATP